MLESPVFRRLSAHAALAATFATGVLAQLVCTPEWESLGPMPAYVGIGRMIYDSSRSRVVLVTGHCAGAGSVWEHDGVAWVAGALMPYPRAYASLAYDAARRETVLHGGYRLDCTYDCNSGPQGFLEDTWTYDGTTWSLRSAPGPSAPRLGAAMGYDAERQLTILHGGGDPYGLCPGGHFDTWEWNGSSWASGAAGPGGIFHTMAFDSVQRRMIVVGLEDSLTWFYDGAWSPGPYFPVAPSTEIWASLAHDSDRGRTVVYADDTWRELDGAAWTVGPPAPVPSWGHVLVYDAPNARTLIVSSGATWGYGTTPISPSTLPNAFQGLPYREVLGAGATGGTLPATFTLEGGTLPPGLVLKPSGVVRGVPTVAGVYSFTVLASGSGSCGIRAYRVTVLGS